MFVLSIPYLLRNHQYSKSFEHNLSFDQVGSLSQHRLPGAELNYKPEERSNAASPCLSWRRMRG